MVSNGFNLTRVFEAMQGRIGWHQPSDGPVLDSDNTSATSGRYYDRGVHKAVTVTNYYETQENATITDADFNQLLQDEDQAVITRCINAVFNRPQLIEHRTNYTRTANVRQIVIPNQGNFCGYRINVAPGNYAVAIDSLSLYFDGAGTFNIYLFNDLKYAPVYTQAVTTQANTQVRVQLDWLMNYLNSQTTGNTGGVWYIGYFQDDLAALGIHALDEQLNLWADSKIFGAYPFQSPKVGALSFNSVNPSVNFRSYGLNMEVSSYRDYTQIIVQNAQLFDEARLLCMAVNVLEQITNTTRSNGLERISQANVSNLAFDMNLAFPTQEHPYVAGLKAQLSRAFKQLNDNFWKRAEPTSVPIGSPNWENELYYEGMDIRNLPSRENAY